MRQPRLSISIAWILSHLYASCHHTVQAVSADSGQKCPERSHGVGQCIGIYHGGITFMGGGLDVQLSWS